MISFLVSLAILLVILIALWQLVTLVPGPWARPAQILLGALTAIVVIVLVARLFGVVIADMPLLR